MNKHNSISEPIHKKGANIFSDSLKNEAESIDNSNHENMIINTENETTTKKGFSYFHSLKLKRIEKKDKDINKEQSIDGKNIIFFMF